MRSNFMVNWCRWGVLLCVLSLGGCGEDPQQLFETAQFEEQQGNHPHAVQLYEQIIQMDADSEWAKQARERITELKK
ncbi:MAG: lipoprotein [Nitrospirales bacterium]|nr:MAG: lipoprotein [Nitrospirales bacterium]